MSWEGNYFNYFTEVEEHFQRARGTSLFLMSPMDWALVESWKNSNVPLEAVLRGIDDAFERWRARKRHTQQVNSLSYCSQAIRKAASEIAGVRKPGPTVEDSMPIDRLRAYLESNAAALGEKNYPEDAASLEEMIANLEMYHRDLESMELRLSAIEERILSRARGAQSEQELVEARQALEAELRPHRSRMSAAELSLLEKSFLDRRLFGKLGLPRLSLYFLL